MKTFYELLLAVFVSLLVIILIVLFAIPPKNKEVSCEKEREKERIYVICGQTKEASHETLCKEVSSSLERRY